MPKYNKKILNHHKRNHNGRARARKDDVPKNAPRAYTRPCGCRPENVANRNKTIAHAIKISKPAMEWSTIRGCWVPHVAKHIKRRFGRCMRHFDIDRDMGPDDSTLAGASA